MSRHLDLTTLDRPILELLAEGRMCVHSVYYENCAGCIIRELERALAMLVDMHDGKFEGKPFHGLVTETEDDVWEAARYRLLAVERPEEARKDECHVCGSDLDTSKKVQMIGRDYMAWCPQCAKWRPPVAVMNAAASKLIGDILNPREEESS